jgi:hypothetical protein
MNRPGTDVRLTASQPAGSEIDAAECYRVMVGWAVIGLVAAGCADRGVWPTGA